MKPTMSSTAVKQLSTWSDVTVRVLFEPAYELAISLFAYTEKQHHHTLDLGAEWVKRVRQSLSPSLSKRLGSAKNRSLVQGFPGVAIIEQSPGDKTAKGFATWMSGMARGEAYDYLTDHLILEGQDDIARIVDAWREMAELLNEWHEEYFRRLPVEILQALTDDAAEKRRLMNHLPADELIQQAAVGVRLDLHPNLRQVVLIPQYHFRPWNFSHFAQGTWYDQYPIEWDASGQNLAWTQLLRLSRALADESRLRILKMVAHGPVRFTDLVAMSDVTKSTVHHHLVALRAARLVVVHSDVEQKQSMYALNPQLADDAKSLLEQVLEL